MCTHLQQDIESFGYVYVQKWYSWQLYGHMVAPRLVQGYFFSFFVQNFTLTVAVQVYIHMNKKGFPTIVFSSFETESCVALELQVCSTTPNLAFVFLITLFTRVGQNHYASICISLLAKDIKLFKILLCRAGEMAQRLRALPALPKDPSSIPSNHMVAHNHL